MPPETSKERGQKEELKASRKTQYAQMQERLRREENLDAIKRDREIGRLSEDQEQEIRTRMKFQEGRTQENVDRRVAGADYDATTNMVLESILDNRDELTSSRFLMEIYCALGIDKIHFAAVAARRRRKHPDFKHSCPIFAKCVKSPVFELLVAVVMFANGLLIGFQVSYAQISSEIDDVFAACEQAFTIFFVLEVIVRIIAEGWQWIWNWGNAADVCLIILTGVVPMWILTPLNVKPGLLRVFGVLRVLRLIRLVRMVRTKQMFVIFWSLIQGILDSGKTLLYTGGMISMVLYVFAIFSVYLIAKDERFVDDEKAQLYFGDVPAAMFTLFQIITLDNWAEVARPLMQKSSLVAPFVIAVIGVVTLVLLNLVIAVIVNNAFERAQKDEDLLAVQKRSQMDFELHALQNLFLDIDKDGNGTLSREEYDEAMKYNENIKNKFQILEVQPHEYDEIWKLLDDSRDGSGEVDIMSFANCLRSMKGGAKAKDSYSILRRVSSLNVRLARVSERLKERHAMANELRDDAAIVRRSLGNLQHEMCEFAEVIGCCIPKAPVKVKTSEIQKHLQELQDETSTLL